MKKCVFILLGATVFSCTRESADTKLQSELAFQSVTMQTGGDGNKITASTTVVGPNLCYKLTHFDISNSKANEIDVYARGTVPAAGQVCAEAIYRKDTTVFINKPLQGTYKLNFWNPNKQLFKSETVTVH